MRYKVMPSPSKKYWVVRDLVKRRRVYKTNRITQAVNRCALLEGFWRRQKKHADQQAAS